MQSYDESDISNPFTAQAYRNLIDEIEITSIDK